MKSFTFFVLVAQAVILQTAYSFIISSPISPYGPVFNSPIVAPSVFSAPSVIRAPGPVISAPVIQPNSVANSLADTLSLLTVSSLLAETLPLPTPMSVLPVSMPYGCGCGFPASTILM